MRVIKPKVRVSNDFHIGIEAKWRGFIIYEGGQLSKRGELKHRAVVHEISPVEVGMSMKNYLLNLRGALIELQCGSGAKWELRLVALNTLAMNELDHEQDKLYDREHSTVDELLG